VLLTLLALTLAAPPPGGIARLHWDAEQLRPTSPLAKSFVATVPELPAIATRELYKDPKTKRYLRKEELASLPPADQKAFEPFAVDETTYYFTRYGSPLSYARPLEILAANGFGDLDHKKVLDFGYGYVGHLRLFALLGADAHGVDVDPMLAAIYRDPSDTGPIKSKLGKTGKVTLHHGQFPKEPKLVEAIGGGYDLIITKNVLKRGYIHPERKADPRHLIDLGVSDDAFLAAFHHALKPGGKVLIFNICPGQAPADKPYIPWADGRSPFTAEQWKKAGFVVKIFDRVDDAEVRIMAKRLGWDLPEDGDPGMDLEHDLFAWYTLVERP
jgi:SAM-dependent methyltransferase